VSAPVFGVPGGSCGPAAVRLASGGRVAREGATSRRRSSPPSDRRLSERSSTRLERDVPAT